MRILLVAPMFPPHRGVASLRTYSFAATWAAAGHDVTVLTTPKRPDQLGLDLPITGFSVQSVPYEIPRLFEAVRRASRPAVRTLPTPTAPGRLGRGWLSAPFRWLKTRTGAFSAVRQPDLTDFWVRPAQDWARSHSPWDSVVSSSGPPAAHLVALGLGDRTGFWMADFRDLWTANHLYSGLFPFTLAERRSEARVLMAVDGLVTVSPGLARRLSTRSGRPAEVIFNGYDADAFASLPAEPAFPADGRIRLVYTGTVYERGQEVGPVCAAVAAESRATLVVASDRSDLWSAAARRYGLGDRLDMRGMIPRPEALHLQRDASALVLLDWRDPRAGVLTGKVFEYLMSPAPIWVIGGPTNSPAAELVRTAGRGVALGSGLERIRGAIRALPALPDGGRLVPNRDFIAGLTRQRQATRFLRLLEEGAATLRRTRT